ncbi:lysophospholipid acyltransferase family protein [Bacteroidota bacterium]
MKLKIIKQNILRFLGLYLLSFTINVLLKTVKITIYNSKKVDDLKDQNYVLGFWHGTMLIPWYLHRNKNFAALVSQSKDGEILTRILKKWKYNVARGSSHIGGKDALEIILNQANNKYSIAITPDGPTGPPRVFKAGAVIVAKKTNVPLVLLGIANHNKYQLKSWDKFEIPRPFSKIIAVYSDPINIDNSLDFDETSTLITECEEKLNQLQIRAEEYCSIL